MTNQQSMLTMQSVLRSFINSSGVEFTKTGTQIYVHIADATRFIHHESKLQSIAYQRVSSIYLPENKIPMIPKDLSEELISLSTTKDNYVLTFSFRITENGKIEKYEIFPAKISKVKRFTYEELDDFFESDYSAKLQEEEKKIFSELNTFAMVREEFRLNNGAIIRPTFKPQVYLDSNGKVDLKLSGFDSLSRRIVAECMIVANEVSAKYAHENSICVPFKGTFSGEIVPGDSNFKIPNSFRNEQELVDLVLKIPKFAHFPRSCITQTPSFHQGLGIHGYTQVTSPIRKSWDLMVHYQIKSCLRGESQPLDWESIQKLLSEMETKKKLIQNLQNDSEKFWIFKYFEQNKEKTFKGLILEYNQEYNYAVDDEFSANLFILENGYVTIFTTKIQHKIGSVIEIQVKEADAFHSVLKFQEKNV
jgi:exoribonuclease II